MTLIYRSMFTASDSNHTGDGDKCDDKEPVLPLGRRWRAVEGDGMTCSCWMDSIYEPFTTTQWVFMVNRSSFWEQTKLIYSNGFSSIISTSETEIISILFYFRLAQSKRTYPEETMLKYVRVKACELVLTFLGTTAWNWKSPSRKRVVT